MGVSGNKSEPVNSDFLGSDGDVSVGSAGKGLVSWVEVPLLVGTSGSSLSDHSVSGEGKNLTVVGSDLEVSVSQPSP